MSAILWTLIGCAAASAHIGLIGGVGPHLTNPLKPKVKVGPVYWTPGDSSQPATSADQRIANEPTALDSELSKLEHADAKLKCDKLHAQYVARHGVTTPTPLKGFAGCAKWSRDEAYWQTRRGQRHAVTSVQNQVLYTIHDSFIW